MVREPNPDQLIPHLLKEASTPLPRRAEDVIQGDTILTPIDIAQAIDVSGFSNPDFPRLILESIGAGARLDTFFAKDIEQMRQAGQVSLAIDVEKAVVMKRLIELGKEIPKAMEENSPQQYQLGREAQELMQKLQSLKDERKNLPEEPNQIAAFARSLGVDPKEAEVNPLGAIQEAIVLANGNLEFRQKFIDALEKSGNPYTGEIKKFIEREEEQNEKGEEKAESKAKKYGKRAAMAGGAVGLMMLLAGWFAMKMESGKRQ